MINLFPQKLALAIAASTFAAMPALAVATQEHNLLETVTVTGTRENASIADTAASVGVIGEQAINNINATHAADLLNRIPGVYIAQLGSTGQGVAAAIRQPVSYGPVYLYLENGIPTRSPAFFNHNALYEVNVAQARGIEVIKGPGSALYGSDAIGGVINVISDSPITDNKLGVNLEGGDFGWRRGQINASTASDEHALSAKIDAIDSEGWRDHTDFNRQSMSIVWQTNIAGFDVNTVYSGSAINMNTGGSSLSEEDYKNAPEQAGNLIGYRDVSAQRLSSSWKKEFASSSLSITPYVRTNDLEYVATWTLNTGREKFIPWLGRGQLDSQDAHINESGHDSAGVQLNYKQDLQLLNNAFWIAGVDYDYSRGYSEQTYIERTDNDSGDYWLEFQRAGSLYDYDVDFTAISPYLHTETDLGDRWRLSAGLRYDSVKYDYRNHLTMDLTSRIHKRPADSSVNMDHLSPKLGLIYSFNDHHNAYAAYRHAFRIPSSSQLFRSGSTVDSTALEPVKADSYELGIRGQATQDLSYEVTLYQMAMQDDILSVTDETGARRNTNTGETEHRGIEMGIGWKLPNDLLLQASYTRAEHRYDDWLDRSGDFSGNHIPNAPRDFANLALTYSPHFLNGGRVEVEWAHQGKQYIDEANEYSYDGHDLINLRASFNASENVELYANLFNATDKLYAETTSKWGPQYTPGRPRSLFAGIKLNFQ